MAFSKGMKPDRSTLRCILCSNTSEAMKQYTTFIQGTRYHSLGGMNEECKITNQGMRMRSHRARLYRVVLSSK